MCYKLGVILIKYLKCIQFYFTCVNFNRLNSLLCFNKRHLHAAFFPFNIQIIM